MRFRVSLWWWQTGRKRGEPYGHFPLPSAVLTSTPLRVSPACKNKSCFVPAL